MERKGVPFDKVIASYRSFKNEVKGEEFLEENKEKGRLN